MYNYDFFHNPNYNKIIGNLWIWYLRIFEKWSEDFAKVVENTKSEQHTYFQK